MIKRIKIALIIVCILHILSFGAPFLYQRTGFGFLIKRIESLLQGGFSQEEGLIEGLILIAFLLPIGFSQVLILSFGSRKQLTYSILWNRIFLIFMSFPTLLAGYFVIQNESIKEAFGVAIFCWWAISYWVLYYLSD